MPLHDKAFYFGLFFILGTLVVGWEINTIFALTGAFLLGQILFNLGWKRSLGVVLISFLGIFYTHLYLVMSADSIARDEAGYFEGLIVKEPEEGINSTKLIVKLNRPHRGEVWVYTNLGINYAYGDVVVFEDVINKSPSGLNIASFPSGLEIIKRGEGSSIKASLINLKRSIVSKLEAALPAKHAALASGLIVGERAAFTDAFEEAMRQSGTTHIVALSGYNIAILAAVLYGTFSYLWSRRTAFYVSLGIIPAFVIMTGAEPSVVRAGIMGLLLLLAEHQNRNYSLRNAITLTALVMILFNPLVGVRDVGFQLSFAALMGIIYLSPILEKKMNIEEEGFLAWKKNAIQTASAQLAVLPIVVSTFGFFSPTALISNVLILELIPITMLFAFLTAILGFLSFHLSLVVGWITSIFLSYEIFIIELFGFAWL